MTGCLGMIIERIVIRLVFWGLMALALMAFYSCSN